MLTAQVGVLTGRSVGDVKDSGRSRAGALQGVCCFAFRDGLSDFPMTCWGVKAGGGVVFET